MKISNIFLKPLMMIIMIGSISIKSLAQPNEVRHSLNKDQSILLALLLDTSNSMDGLIEQAKSQLWKVVNELAAAKCTDGSRPSIKIALYEYGNDNLSPDEGYVRQVNGLTDDLDL